MSGIGEFYNKALEGMLADHLVTQREYQNIKKRIIKGWYGDNKYWKKYD